MCDRRLTPEEVIGQMSYSELQELLEDLEMVASVETAVRLKRLVRDLGRFEEAIETLARAARRTDAA